MMNSSQDRVNARKKAANSAGHSKRHGDQQQHLPLGGAQVAGRPLDPRLRLAHLGVAGWRSTRAG